MKDPKKSYEDSKDTELHENSKEQELTKQEALWFLYKNLLWVHRAFYEKGILIVRTNLVNKNKQSEQKELVSNECFHAFNRTLCFFNQVTMSTVKAEKNLSKSKNIVKAGENSSRPDIPSLTRSQNLTIDLLKYKENKQNHCSSSQIFFREFSNTNLLFNRSRREEIFFPVTFNSGKVGMYIYPWLIDKKGRLGGFQGFTRYVGQMCLFGSNLQGVDKRGNNIALIKHDLNLYEDQKITTILYDKVPSPYEQLALHELKRIAFLVNELAKHGKKDLNQEKECLKNNNPPMATDPEQGISYYLHLPYYDYVLFGVQLYIGSKITLTALNEFFEIIFRKTEKLSRTIKDLFKPFKFEVQIMSPFDNLFGPIHELLAANLDKEENLAGKIFM
jgi:hypothetical protein